MSRNSERIERIKPKVSQTPGEAILFGILYILCYLVKGFFHSDGYSSRVRDKYIP